MNTEITVAIISLIGVIITALVTKSSFAKELDKKVAVIEERLKSIDKKVEEHNGYARMFQENIPVIKEKISVQNHRIDDLEKKVG